jgi:hypothetical protein
MAAASASVALPAFVPARAFGANGQAKLGVIGVGRRALQVMRLIPNGARIVAISDCYAPRMEWANWQFYPKWRLYQDYRKMLDDEDLDGVIIANRAHQRVLPSIHACQAGVDVYAEKPLTLYIHEGRVLIEAVKKHGTVFQVGTQSRSLPLNQWICDFLRRGGIGRIEKVLAVNQPGPITLTEFEKDPIPDGLDWDAWLNQAPPVPFNESLFHSPYKYRPFDGWDVTNWVHGLDMIQCGLGKDETGPVDIWPEEEYDGEPNVRPVYLRYADGVTICYTTPKKRGPDGGGVFAGSKCKLELNFNKFVTNPVDFVKDAPEPLPVINNHIGMWTTAPHLTNWVDCIKTRQQPAAPIESGHRAMTLCHLINICRELRRRLRWDPASEIFPNDSEAMSLVNRARRKGYELPDVL